jgi:hypothetical protein
MLRRLLPALALALVLAPSAHAAQLCAWMIESNETDEDTVTRNLDLYLQSDTDMDIYLKIVGQGIVNGMGHMNSPVSATETLEAGKPNKVWGFGATLDAPAKIDETAEIHKPPADIFSDAPTPLYAKFVFQRNVPESEEKKPSAVFAKHQCVTVKP